MRVRHAAVLAVDDRRRAGADSDSIGRRAVLGHVWYDAGGNLAAEYSQSSQQAALGCTTCYLLTDHLGSTRVMTDQNGNAVAGGCHDYLPFGEEISAGVGGRSGPCYVGSYKPGLLFTGKLRDAWEESQLDYFGARYDSTLQLRFTSPDRVLADQDLADPQSWNMYVYVRKNLSDISIQQERSSLVWRH